MRSLTPEQFAELAELVPADDEIIIAPPGWDQSVCDSLVEEGWMSRTSAEDGALLWTPTPRGELAYRAHLAAMASGIL